MTSSSEGVSKYTEVEDEETLAIGYYDDDDDDFDTFTDGNLDCSCEDGGSGKTFLPPRQEGHEYIDTMFHLTVSQLCRLRGELCLNPLKFTICVKCLYIAQRKITSRRFHTERVVVWQLHLNELL